MVIERFVDIYMIESLDYMFQFAVNVLVVKVLLCYAYSLRQFE